MGEPGLIGISLVLLIFSTFLFVLPIYLIVEWHWAAILLVMPLYPLGFLAGIMGTMAFWEGL
jgi:hypothetical protein